MLLHRLFQCLKKRGSQMLKSLDRWLTDLVLKVVPLWCKPNHITAARILLIPIVWALYYGTNPWAATGMFAFLVSTDFVDGRVARGRGMVTHFGKQLDIGCDLALVWSTVILLWRDGVIQMQSDSVLFWLLIFILIREIVVTIIRKSFRVRANEVRVLKLGKCKTAFFMLGLTVLLTSTVTTPSATAGTTLLAIAAVCSFLSGVQYIQQFSKPGIRWER